MSRRDQIRMGEGEVLALLDEERVVVCATNGRDGFPHLMPLWYVVRDGELWAWTYAKSQKVRNLERDPRCTLQVESGRGYAELRGVMLECEAIVHRELEDGAVVVEYTFKGIDYLVKEILKEAGDAAVLEPAEAREAVLAAAERLLAPSS